MKRRDFLKASVAVALTAGGSLPVVKARAATPSRLIDAHCHIFNADDLPIVQFIEKVALPQQADFKQYATKYGHALRFMVRFLADWMKEDAPGAVAETDLIQKIDSGLAQPRTREQIREQEIGYLADLIERFKNLRIREKSFPFQDQLIAYYLPGAVVAFLHREAYPESFTDTGIGNIDHAFDPDYWRDSKDLARQVYLQAKGPMSRYLRWGLIFTRHRFEIADELNRIHGDRAKLMTPALVDFSRWLNDKYEVNLPAQVRVMGMIARRKGTLRIHGYAPFDPLREAVHRKTNQGDESPFALAKRAVAEEGFIGIKLYPPMGFLPLDNAKKLSAGDYPRRLQKIFGTKLNVALDAALSDLYCWCVAEEVPILSHAADSNGSDEGYEHRANPDNWAVVTQNFPGVRLALAHFGDFQAGFDRPGNRRPKLSNTWEWKMAALSKQSTESQVFIDISYMTTPLLDKNHARRQEVLRMLRTLRTEFGSIAERLLFGTDWLMFGKEGGFAAFNRNARFAEQVVELFEEAGFLPVECERIMYFNAGNFLGLALPPNQVGNRQRLNKFYGENSLPAGWLDDFPIQPGGTPAGRQCPSVL